MQVNKRIFRLMLFLVVALMLLGFLTNNAEAYTVTGWVWHDRKKINWDPTLLGGAGCGSMAQPVRYTITNPGLQGAIALGDQETQAFDAANAWNGATGGIINYYFSPGEVSITWVGDGTWNPPLPNMPGDTNPADGLIQLNLARTTMSNLWTISAAGGALQFDMYTTLIHELGHDLGLWHRNSASTIMTGQNLARTNGWWAAAPPPPLPAGAAQGWFNPRAALTDDDILGAITLYTVPKPVVAAVPAPAKNPATGRWVYHYTVFNDADSRSDHRINGFRVSIPAGSAPATVITVTPAGWAGAKVGNTVTWTAGAVGNHIAPPGAPAGTGVVGPLHFEFENPNPPAMGAPQTGWNWPHCDFAGPGSPNGDYEPGDLSPPNVVLAFDPNNAWIPSYDVYVPGASVGGVVVPVDKLALLAPYINTILMLFVVVAAAAYVKRVKCTKEKQ